MQRLAEAKACFLSETTENMPKPDDLVQLLDQVIQVRLFIISIFTFSQ